MKITILNRLFLMIMSINIYYNEITPIFEHITVNGYVRAGYDIHHIKKNHTFKDGALGGKLHLETAVFNNINVGASFYTSNSIGPSDNRGLVPFRGEIENSYTIMGEAYIKATFGNTILKFGRQEIDTPFAGTDDIGMVPNTFEAYILKNKDILNTTLFVGQIQKMAGVDAEIVDAFTRINSHNNMQTIGLSYNGIKNVQLAAWYYHLKDADIDNISYIEATYSESKKHIDYTLGVQYAKQTYSTKNNTSVYGVTASIGSVDTGLTLKGAYNKARGNVATSGFGGGPFFSNSEYLILDNAGKNSTQKWIGVEFDATTIGIDGLTLCLSKATLKNEFNKKSTELDFVAEYTLDNNMELHMIYSDIDGSNVGADNVNHFRAFANYIF